MIFSCNDSKEYYNWSGGVINKYGNYHLLNRQYIIKVADNNSTLDYALLDSMSNALNGNQRTHKITFVATITFILTFGGFLFLKSKHDAIFKKDITIDFCDVYFDNKPIMFYYQ